MPPVISIITVSYNAGNEIEKTIRSVLSQSFRDYEYVFIDGASTDNTVEIIERYRSTFEKMEIACRVISEKDKGIYDAMNKGVRESCGQWVLMLNAGDLFTDDHVLEDMFSGEKHEGKILYGDVVLSQRSGKRTYFQYQRPKKLDSICYALPFCHQSVFVPRELMAQHGFDTDFKIAADYNFFSKVYKAGALFHYIPRAVSVYDLDGVSATNVDKLFAEYKKVQTLYFPDTVQSEQPSPYGPIASVKQFIKKMVPSVVYSKARGWSTSLEEILKENKIN